MRLCFELLNKLKGVVKKEEQKQEFTNIENITEESNYLNKIFDSLESYDLLIKLDRSSINLEDDFESHIKNFKMSNQMILSEFINKHVNSYLPDSNGKESIWILRAKHMNKWINLAIINKNDLETKLLIDNIMLYEVFEDNEKYEMVLVYEGNRILSEVYDELNVHN